MKTPSAKVLAKKADEYEKTRKERLALSKQVQALEKKEKELYSFLLATLRDTEGLSTIGGSTVVVSIKEDEVPIVEDKEVFRKYLNRTKNFELSQALRPAAKAIKELWDEGKEVPGIAHMKIDKLSRSAK